MNDETKTVSVTEQTTTTSATTAATPPASTVKTEAQTTAQTTAAVSNTTTAGSVATMAPNTAATTTAGSVVTTTNVSIAQNENSPLGNSETIINENTAAEITAESETAEPAITTVPTTEPISTTVTTEITNVSETEMNIESETSAIITEITSAETTETIETVSISQEAMALIERFKNLDMKSYIKLGLIVVLIIAFICVMVRGRKKRKSSNENEMSAKKLDEKRLAEKEKKNKSAKNKKKKTKTKNVNKTAQATLPYKRVLKNNVWLIAPNTYSKAYSFADINYNVGDVPEQIEVLQNYSAYLNTLDDTIDYQITCWNSKINVEQFEKDVMIELQNDKYDVYRKEYNERVLKANLYKGNNFIQKKMFITLTVKTPDEEYAQQKFKSLDTELRNGFERIGNTHLKVLTSQERVELLKDFFVGCDETIPTFSENDFKNRIEKIYCCPDYFEFKSNYFMFNDKYAKCIFIKDYPSKASDSIISDLIGTNLEIMVTTNVIAHDPAKARKLVQRQITAIDTNMAQRESKAAQHGNFSSQMPVRIKNQLDGYKSLYDKLTIDDQKLFSCNTIIMMTAKTFDELKNAEDIISSTLKRNGCMLGQMQYQQEAGMIDCLPVGSQRKFEFRRTLPTESVAIFQPYNVKEVRMRNAIYYGLNVLSDNFIALDRIKLLINPCGFILGAPGGGKSFTAKREMMEVFMRTDADILIIDPEREYQWLVEMFGGANVKIALGSSNYINPFDFEFSMLDDEEIDVIADKCQLITSFISCMDKEKPLNAQEVSFIDRCVRVTYEKSNVQITRNKADMPKLSDFYDVIRNEEDVDEQLKQKIKMTIEMYVDGSAKYFNNATNVDINNRVISYDIKDLNDILKTQAMLLILDYIWNRLSANRDKGKPTWIYIDEVYLLFADKYCLEYLRKLYKRARKYGGVVTGITQNVEDLLRDDSCRTMLSNSEWIVLLKQAPADIARLKDTLKFNDSEVAFVQNVKPGQGLLVLGGKDKIPFYDEFPKDTDLYRRINTSFSERAEQQMKKQK